MIRPLRRLATAAAAAGAAIGIGALADRVLALDPFVSGAPTTRPIRSRVTIDTARDVVWAALADVPAQPLWMREMKEVRVTTDGPIGVGTRGEADVRIFGIGVTDPVEIVAFDPPRRFAIRHLGRFTGGGEIAVDETPEGTVVTWDERLVPPWLPELGALLSRPILGRIFQADLDTFRRLVEAGELPRTVALPTPGGVAPGS